MPPNTVKVCRPSIFGNPFVVGVDGTAAECVEKFAMDIYHPNGRVGFEVDDAATLRGKNLACWCKLGAPCHADVLLDLANVSDQPPERPAVSGAAPCSPWRPGNRPPSLPLTVIGVVQNKPVLVWYHTRTRAWHDNPAAFGSVPVEWWQYLPDCELLKAKTKLTGAQGPV